MGLTCKQDKNSLTRIRDNQRRSRAKRKEYLVGLETKWRICELTGVEASAEIQNVARRVAEENKQLRSLLLQRGGMTEYQLDEILGYESENPENPSPTALLDKLLTTKKPCCSNNLELAPAGVTRSSDKWDPLTPPVLPSVTYPTTNTPSLISSTQHSNTENITAFRMEGNPQLSHSYQPLLLPEDMPAPVPSMPLPVVLPQGRQISGLPIYGQQTQVQTQYQAPTAGISHELPHQIPPFDQSPQPVLPAANNFNNTTSCAFASDLIAGATRDVPPGEIRKGLGCPPGTDCEVDNYLLFQVMDRYQG
ncbi:MAG: hypothetical protein M1829_003187 [Trizodia sp. TS-e1964]|nr:MAG: hypothetical protein M1829_003187 [Trizodia sp. TS-e1964]